MKKRQIKKFTKRVRDFKKYQEKFKNTREGFLLPSNKEFEKWTEQEQKEFLEAFRDLTSPKKRTRRRAEGLNKVIEIQTEKDDFFSDRQAELRNFNAHIDLRAEITEYAKKSEAKRVTNKTLKEREERYKAYKTLPQKGTKEVFNYDVDFFNETWQGDFRYLETKGYILDYEFFSLPDEIANAIRPYLEEANNGGYYTTDKAALNKVLSIVKNYNADNVYFKDFNKQMIKKDPTKQIAPSLARVDPTTNIKPLKKIGWTNEEIVEMLVEEGLSEKDAWKAVANKLT